MITRDVKYLTGEPSLKLIQGVLAQFDEGAKERKRMRDYYDGKHAILERKKVGGTSNNKLVTNHAKYIADLASAYLIGSPVAYADEAQAQALEALTEAYRRCNIDSVDAELAKHAGIYGVGIELLYMDAQARPRSATLDPRNAFVVYDDTVAQAPLMGIRRVACTDEEGKAAGQDIYVYTADRVYRYTAKEGSNTLTAAGEAQTHNFGGVPMVEYWNNEDERGDFAPVLTLIDAYNLLTSDRINDKEQLVNAILVIAGASLGDTEEEKNDAVKRLRDEQILEVPGDGVDIKYLIKQLVEQDVQTLADALTSDIHKISMVPAMTDENFAGQATGVAMKFKLLGLEQLTKAKERFFCEALRNRARLFAHVLSVLGKPALDPETVQLTFMRGLPVNELEKAQMIQCLQNIVPDEILISQLPFVTEPTEVIKLLQKQRDEKLKQQQVLLDPYRARKGDEAKSA